MPGPESAPYVLATQHWDRPQAEPSAHFGAWVAAEDFFAALVRYGSWDRYDFFAVPSRRDRVARRLSDLRADRTRVRDFSDLPASGADLGISAWHGISLNSGVIPFELRRRYPDDVFPITLAAHQTISYQDQLHRSFLPLVLADALPCDSLICSSRASRQVMEALLEVVAERFNHRYGTDVRFGGRLDTLPIGVDTDTFCPGDQALARRRLMLPAEPLILLWLGRISAMDKADLGPLLSAFADVRQYTRALGESRPLMLLIAGSDQYGDAGALENQARELGIADSVRIRTQVDELGKALYYNAADIFVAPVDSIQESFGITPVEAMACGVPQVAADWDGYRDTVSDGETGYLVRTLWSDCDGDLVDDLQSWQDRTDHSALAQSVAVDPTGLRSGLIKLVSDGALRARMAVASRQRAEDAFAWPRVIARQEDLWQELSAIAASVNAQSYAPPYDQPLFFDAFRHYATTILDDASEIRRSPAGTAALERGGELALARGNMSPRLLRHALEELGEDGCRFGELVSRLRSGGGEPGPEPYVRRHVMQLLKHGYAQLA